MSNTQDTATTKIYSPNQVAFGALGGPVGLIYFLWANFSILKKENLTKATIILGLVFIITLIFAAPYVPKEVPALAFSAMYVITAYILSRKFHLNKSEITSSEEYTFHSSFRVFLSQFHVSGGDLMLWSQRLSIGCIQLDFSEASSFICLNPKLAFTKFE